MLIVYFFSFRASTSVLAFFIAMLKSCQYCGRIHEAALICEPKGVAQKKRIANIRDNKARQFRRSTRWTNKSIAIRERDHHLCLCCLHGLPETYRKYNTRNLSVHHITPLEEDYNKRLDDDNLITLCSTHHDMAERGEISRDALRSMILKTRDSAGGNDFIC